MGKSLAKKSLFAGAVLGLSLITSCGGFDTVGEGNGSSGSGGLYELGIVLDQGTTITSRTPTVFINPETGEIRVETNPDEISGYVYYRYRGKNVSNAMRLYIIDARMCINGAGCYLININSTGSLLPSEKLRFGKHLELYKFTKPWLEVNPYEDTVINTTTKGLAITTPRWDNTLNLYLSDEYAGYGTIKRARAVSVYELVLNDQGQEMMGSLLCNTVGNRHSCIIERVNGAVSITFNANRKPNRVYVEYSEEFYVDLNKDITITNFSRKTTNSTDGYIYVKGQLSNGDTLQATLPIKFLIVR